VCRISLQNGGLLGFAIHGYVFFPRSSCPNALSLWCSFRINFDHRFVDPNPIPDSGSSQIQILGKPSCMFRTVSQWGKQEHKHETVLPFPVPVADRYGKSDLAGTILPSCDHNIKAEAVIEILVIKCSHSSSVRPIVDVSPDWVELLQIVGDNRYFAFTRFMLIDISCQGISIDARHYRGAPWNRRSRSLHCLGSSPSIRRWNTQIQG
jgi:hypothetical protein